eukprot:GHVH01007818.1.p1 GENE.GHVH01007818.1~~GHVH01007818.1.p1  ORF type:complete len:675 (+),score=105.75 GHVH01007818.1:216-2240(+)
MSTHNYPRRSSVVFDLNGGGPRYDTTPTTSDRAESGGHSERPASFSHAQYSSTYTPESPGYLPNQFSPSPRVRRKSFHSAAGVINAGTASNTRTTFTGPHGEFYVNNNVNSGGYQSYVVEQAEPAEVKLPIEVDYNKLLAAKRNRRTELRSVEIDADAEIELEGMIGTMRVQKCDKHYYPVNSLENRYCNTKALTSYRDEPLIHNSSRGGLSVTAPSVTTDRPQRYDPRRLQDFFECETSIQALLELRKEPLRFVRDVPSYAMLDIMGCLVKYEEDLARVERSEACTDKFDKETCERVFREEVTVQMCIDYIENAPYLRKRNLSYLIAAKEMYNENVEVIDRIQAAKPPDAELSAQYLDVYPKQEKIFYSMETLQIMCWLRTLWFLRTMTVEHAVNVDSFLQCHAEHLNKLGRMTEIRDESIWEVLRNSFNNLVDPNADSPTARTDLKEAAKKSADDDTESDLDDQHPEAKWPPKWIQKPNTSFPPYAYHDHLAQGLMGDWKQYTVIGELLKLSCHDLQLVFENLAYCDTMPFWKTRVVLQFFAAKDGYWDEMQTLNRNLNSCTPFAKESVFKSPDAPEDDTEIDPKPGFGDNNFVDLSYYQMLGIPKTAIDTDIQKAYRKKAKEYHPDKMKENDDQLQWNDQDCVMKFINEARDVLLDEQARQFYDHFGKKRH